MRFDARILEEKVYVMNYRQTNLGVLGTTILALSIGSFGCAGTESEMDELDESSADPIENVATASQELVYGYSASNISNATVNTVNYAGETLTPQVNVLENSGFEQLTNSGVPNAWVRSHISIGGSVSRDASLFKGGDYSLKLVDGSNTQAEGLRSEAFMPVTPGVFHTAEAFIRRTETTSGGSIYIKYYDAALSEIGSFSAGAPSSLDIWHYVSVSGRAPATAIYAKVICYSHMAAVGTVYFDGVSFRRSPSQSLVDNPDMSLDVVSASYPMNWEKWASSSQPVSVAQDPVNAANNVMKLADASTTQSANARTRIPVTPNLSYTASADIYRASGSAPQLYLKYYDKAGIQIDSVSVSSSSPGVWVNKSVTRKAPENAVECEVLAYIAEGNIGVAYFDNFDLKENYLTQYVAPTALGTGTGSSAANAAKYNNVTFWAAADTQLATQSVKVILAEGDYIINSAADSLTLTNIGDASNVLIMEGARPVATVFTKNNSAADGMTGNAITLNYATNVVLRHLHWEDDVTMAAKQTAYSLVINSGANSTAETKNIMIEGCSFIGLDQNYYGAMGVHHKRTHKVTTRNCEFVRVGVDGSAHMIYHSYGPKDLQVLDSYFQDCTGAYVRFRAGCESGRVEACTFVSTNATCNRHFIEQAVFNDITPGDEVLGNGFTYTGNRFDYIVASGNDRVAVQFTANGYNPVDANGVKWDYLLTPSDRTTLLSGTITEKKTLIKDHFDLDFGVDTMISGNTRTGSHLNKLRLESYAKYGAVKICSVGEDGVQICGDGEYDISNLGDE